MEIGSCTCSVSGVLKYYGCPDNQTKGQSCDYPKIFNGWVTKFSLRHGALLQELKKKYILAGFL